MRRPAAQRIYCWPRARSLYTPCSMYATHHIWIQCWCSFCKTPCLTFQAVQWHKSEVLAAWPLGESAGRHSKKLKLCRKEAKIKKVERKPSHRLSNVYSFLYSFWPHCAAMWDLSSPTRGQTRHLQHLKRGVLATGSPGMSLHRLIKS